jgi:hypothetical protein
MGAGKMSVSSIGASSVQAYSPQQRQRPNDAISQGVDGLLKAVQSGDKDSIQSAYDSLSKAVGDKNSSSSSTSSTSSTDENNPLAKLLSTVGTALESGDVSGLAETVAAQGPGGAGGPPPGGPPPGGPPPGGGGGGPGGGGGGPPEEVRTGLTGLSESLSSGDLTSAQSAYSALAEALKQDADAPEDFTSKLADIGSALSSGSLSSAQELFSSLLPRGSSVDIAA